MLVFIDESGYPRPTDENEYSVLMAVCVYEKDIKAIDNDIFKLKNLIYEKQDEIKATNIIKRQTIEKNRTKNKEYAEVSFLLTVKKSAQQRRTVKLELADNQINHAFVSLKGSVTSCSAFC